MKQTIKIQKIFIVILITLSLAISMLSYKLQIEYIAAVKENQELKEIIENVSEEN